MRRFFDAWDRHRALPQSLAQRARDAGFDEVTLEGHASATAGVRLARARHAA